MKHQSKFSEEQKQQPAAEQQTQSASAREFATVEEALRYDAAHTTVPPAIGERLQKSTADLPKPKTGWWRKIFGGGL